MATSYAKHQGLGIDDDAPVTHENFRQWVIEDAFCAGRPSWEDAGATLTDDVHPYESMKIRILNAGHQFLANAGELLGCETIASCMANPDIKAFFNSVQMREVLPHVDAVKGTPATEYLELVESRFSNPKIHDTTRRVSFDGSSRHPGFVLPIIRDASAADAPVDGLALVEALWARMCAGTREDGSIIEANDPFWDDLTETAKAAKSNPKVWLDMQQTYGDLGDNGQFADAFERWLKMLWSDGTQATLQTYASQS